MELIIEDEKWFNTHCKIIQDENVDKEIKLFCILQLLHDEYISLHKAHELCTEIGLFSDHWITIDAKTTGIWQKYF